MKRNIVWCSALFLLMTFFAGCHSSTAEGFGRDVQKVGQKIEG